MRCTASKMLVALLQENINQSLIKTYTFFADEKNVLTITLKFPEAKEYLH